MTDKLLIDRELLPCPFCGGEADPKGWMNGSGEHGPECEQCGATARSISAWNTRAAPRQPEGDLEVVGWLHCADRTRLMCAMGKERDPQGSYTAEFTTPLCRLSDAQRAIADRDATIEHFEISSAHSQRAIAELREECERLKTYTDGLHSMAEAVGADMKAERDTLRQQRDKLAGLLREALDIKEAWYLKDRIDAALAEVGK